MQKEHPIPPIHSLLVGFLSCILQSGRFACYMRLRA